MGRVIEIYIWINLIHVYFFKDEETARDHEDSEAEDLEAEGQELGPVTFFLIESGYNFNAKKSITV